MPTDAIPGVVRHHLQRGRKVAVTRFDQGVTILVQGMRACQFIVLCDESCQGAYARVGTGRSLYQAKLHARSR